MIEPIACGTPTMAETAAATGMLNASPSMPLNRSPTDCVSRMYAAQPHGRDHGEQQPERVDAAGPRLGEHEHAGQREHRPDEVAPAVAARDRDAERAEELDGHRRPERDALDRGEERDGRDRR